MKKFFILLLFAAASLLSADDLRIISLSPALTEAMFLLDRGDMLAARSSACVRPAEALEVPVAGAFGEIDAEKILSLHPDIVIADTVMDLSLVRPLEEAGIKFLILPCSAFSEYIAALAELGRVTDSLPAALAVISELEEERKLIRPLETGIRTLWVVWQDPVIVAGRNTLPDEAMAMAGLVNAAEDDGYIKPSPEWLLDCRAQLIVISQEARPLSGEEYFRFLPAVRRGRIIRLDKDTPLERPCREFVSAVSELRNKIGDMLK